MFSIEHLDVLRRAEIDAVLPHLGPPGARILELGAGTGRQAAELAGHGFAVEAIELPDSNYAGDRLFPITDYDGRHIPFPDASFDVVFSSNVLEHVPDLAGLHREIRRVLKSGGVCLHVLPTHAWRGWTTLSAFPAALQHLGALLRPGARKPPGVQGPLKVGLRAIRHLGAPLVQRRHGERGTVLSELWLFHPRWWRDHFRRNGFAIAHEAPMGLFYTGHMVFGGRWPLEKRRRMARVLGSACHLFKLRVDSHAPDAAA